MSSQVLMTLRTREMYRPSRRPLVLTGGLAALGLGLLLVVRGAVGSTVDAVSAASLRITGGSTTATTAVLNFWEKENKNGALHFCYDTTTALSQCAVTFQGRGTGKVSIANLTPGKSYYYRFWGVYENKTPGGYQVSGRLSTESVTSVRHTLSPDPMPARPAAAVDVRGRRLPGSGRAYGAVSLHVGR